METNNLYKMIFPFTMTVDPMERLLLINFEKDTDTIYVGFEPQVFHDTQNGVGHLVIGWRKDKKVDVYFQKSLNLDHSKYNIAGDGLHKMIPADMEQAFFEVKDTGVHAHYKFMDLYGRKVELLVHEQNSNKRKPFGLLAPMGDAATYPTALPLVILHDFYFVRKHKTHVVIEIDGKNHQLDSLPVPMDWQTMTFARYSPKPLIVTVNNDFEGEIEPFVLEVNQQTYTKGPIRYDLEWCSGIPFIKVMCSTSTSKLIAMNFDPPIPSLSCLSKTNELKGQFNILGHESIGTVSGEYYIHSDYDGVKVQMIPTHGWKPRVTKFSTWFLFSVAKVFKKWPSTYHWNAKVHMNQEGVWHMHSKWTRNARIMKG